MLLAICHDHHHYGLDRDEVRPYELGGPLGLGVRGRWLSRGTTHLRHVAWYW